MRKPAMLMLLFVGCAARAGLPAGADTHAPKLVAWEGRDANVRLWPETAHSTQVVVAPAATPGQLFAYGIADGKKVVWAFLLSAGSLGSLFEMSQRDQPTNSTMQDSVLGWSSHGGAGSTTKPPPNDPPTPIGDEIRQSVVRTLLIGADRIRTDVQSLGDQLAR
jgi:hypothetical protein